MIMYAALGVQLMGGATEAKKGMFSIANDVSSWWANLDPGVPKPSQPLATSSRSAAEVQQVTRNGSAYIQSFSNIMIISAGTAFPSCFGK